MDEKQFDGSMRQIISALKEKGYDPVNQINGYLIFKDLSYITRHNNARDIIETLDKSQIYRYMQNHSIKD